MATAECVKCHRMRSDKYMQEAVFLNFVGNEPAGVFKCSSSESCKKARKICPGCGHMAQYHVNHLNWFGGEKNITACYVNMGMGDPCGCRHYERPQ